MEHRFSLEKYSSSKSRTICPKCKIQKKTFVQYIDNETGEYVANNVGRCNRESKCGYHYPPKQYFSDHGQFEEFQIKISTYTPLPPKPPSYIDFMYVLESKSSIENNHFATFLYNNFETYKVTEALNKYYVGTSNKFGGSVIFWFIDTQMRVRNGKVMVYDIFTGKRSKTLFTSAPVLLKLKDFNSQPCFFGEHLLANNNKPIGIVESEKTAIIASLYFEEYIWLASSGKSSLTPLKCEILSNREVYLFPDSDGYESWEKKANQLGFSVSNIFQFHPPGYDLADFILDNIHSL